MGWILYLTDFEINLFARLLQMDLRAVCSDLQTYNDNENT